MVPFLDVAAGRLPAYCGGRRKESAVGFASVSIWVGDGIAVAHPGHCRRPPRALPSPTQGIAVAHPWLNPSVRAFRHEKGCFALFWGSQWPTTSYGKTTGASRTT